MILNGISLLVRPGDGGCAAEKVFNNGEEKWSKVE